MYQLAIPKVRFIVAAWAFLALPVSESIVGRLASAQGVASLQSGGSRPFVTGVTPVIGANGAVGGIQVDPQGLVNQLDPKQLLMDRKSFRPRSQSTVGMATSQESARRVISLSNLDRELADRIERGDPVPGEMLMLAGMRSIEFVVSDLATHDVLIVGPAGDWETNRAGESKSVSSGSPVLRLQDFVECLRMARHSNRGPISCSIEPTEEGQQRYAKARSRVRSFSRQSADALQSAMGDQQVLIEGVDPTSRFAQVLVSADVAMKRLAMGYDASPVANMPSYLDSLKSRSVATRLTSPRWWMVPNYPPMKCSADRLTWQIHGSTAGISTMTQDSTLGKNGTRDYQDAANPLAQHWADAMSEHYDKISREITIFGELRNCINLAVACSLIAHEGLDVQADCDWTILTDPSRLTTPKYQVPERIPSKAALVAGKAGWIVSVSGGVELDPWGITKNVDATDSVAPINTTASADQNQPWWWDIP